MGGDTCERAPLGPGTAGARADAEVAGKRRYLRASAAVPSAARARGSTAPRGRIEAAAGRGAPPPAGSGSTPSLASSGPRSRVGVSCTPGGGSCALRGNCSQPRARSSAECRGMDEAATPPPQPSPPPFTTRTAPRPVTSSTSLSARRWSPSSRPRPGPARIKSWPWHGSPTAPRESKLRERRKGGERTEAEGGAGGGAAGARASWTASIEAQSQTAVRLHMGKGTTAAPASDTRCNSHGAMTPAALTGRPPASARVRHLCLPSATGTRAAGLAANLQRRSPRVQCAGGGGRGRHSGGRAERPRESAPSARRMRVTVRRPSALQSGHRGRGRAARWRNKQTHLRFYRHARCLAAYVSSRRQPSTGSPSCLLLLLPAAAPASRRRPRPLTMPRRVIGPDVRPHFAPALGQCHVC